MLAGGGGVLAAGLGALALRLQPPGPGSIWPGCLFHQATGLYCPGCGITRCAAALVRGDVGLAWAMNPLVVSVLGVGLAALIATALPARYRHRLAPLGQRLGDARTWAVAVGVFFVGRNLPWWPFVSWAPG